MFFKNEFFYKPHYGKTSFRDKVDKHRLQVMNRKLCTLSLICMCLFPVATVSRIRGAFGLKLECRGDFRVYHATMDGTNEVKRRRDLEVQGCQPRGTPRN